jgi:predicted signal transduction protein with EAL and GGDEF domain
VDVMQDRRLGDLDREQLAIQISPPQRIADADRHRLIRELGCDLVQGYEIAQPLAVDQVHDWLTRNTPGHTMRSKSAQMAA